jgi:anti-sigma regulatory factor (Ser/Thr protein kinase)
VLGEETGCTDVRSPAEHTWTLSPGPAAAAEARDHVTDACRGLEPRQLEVARLLVTELVTNALQHGSGEVVLGVVRADGDEVRVEVNDDSSAMPVLATPPSLAEHGWGLRIVAEFSGSWGTAPRRDGRPGKQVWFALS